MPGVMPGGEHTYMSYDLPWANSSNTPFRLFKHWVHEGGISTPFAVRWPEVTGAGGTVVHSPSHFVDIMASCIEASGAKYPQHRMDKPTKPLAGESFLAALRGSEWSRVQPIVWEHEGNQALRSGNWKLVRKYNQPWELYNFDEDRTELVDKSAGESFRMKSMLKQYQQLSELFEVRDWDTVKEIARAIYPGIV